MSLPIVVPEREPLTLAEARRIGLAATRFATLQSVLGLATGGSITVSTRNGVQAIHLTQIDLTACLALLMERETQFLASMGVAVEQPL